MLYSAALTWHAPQPFRLVAGATFLLLCFSFPPQAVAQDHVGQLSVRVRDRRTETQLEQARVQLIRFPDEIVSEQFTGTDGGVTFTGISVGAYTIKATRQGYETGEASVDFRRGDSALQNVDILLMPLTRNGDDLPAGSISADDLRIPESARKEFERAKRLLNEKKNPRESIISFQRAIELYPDYADAYFLLGVAQLQVNDASAAEASLRKAISLDARRTGPYYPLAMILFSQRKFSDEQQILLQAQALDPSDWRWAFEIARADAQQGNWNEALQGALAVRTMPNAPTKIHLLLGDIYSNTGRLKESIDELELFLHLDPQSPFVPRIQQVLPELRRKLAAGPTAQP